MKKLIIILLVITILVGCSMSNTPSAKVEEYLSNYNSLSDSVIIDIENKISHEDLSSDNKGLYNQVLRRLYQNMKYEIKNESIDGNNANVTVKITVYDLFKTEGESLEYLADHSSEFNDETGMFSNDLYNKFRLGEMLKTNNQVDYEIIFKLYKKDNMWYLENPDEDTLLKLNGLYNYQEN